MDYNHCTLVGYVGKDPEIKTFSNGGKVANISIATTRRFPKKDGGMFEQTTWHRVVIKGDGRVGVVEKYVQKGTRILVSGEYISRQWKNKDGVTQYSYELNVVGQGQLLLLGKANEQGASPSSSPAAAAPTQDFDDEIPF